MTHQGPPPRLALSLPAAGRSARWSLPFQGRSTPLPPPPPVPPPLTDRRQAAQVSLLSAPRALSSRSLRSRPPPPQIDHPPAPAPALDTPGARQDLGGTATSATEPVDVPSPPGARGRRRPLPLPAPGPDREVAPSLAGRPGESLIIQAGGGGFRPSRYGQALRVPGRATGPARH